MQIWLFLELELVNMENNNTDEKTKNFDTVKTFRKIKTKISKETYGMSIDDFKNYLSKKSSEFQNEQKELSTKSE
jgi:3,4-dihydroxy-2-butanone 4-phosphate synthase